MPRSNLRVTVIGAGIVGLWQAVRMADDGHRVTLVDPATETGAHPASWFAGGMLAPDCEGETTQAYVTRLGRESIGLWQARFPAVHQAGTLVVAAARDRSELDRFARLTTGHASCDAAGVGELEPLLAGRFRRGLYFADEAHLSPRDALAALSAEATRKCEIAPEPPDGTNADWILDCRGLGARGDLPGLRGVRGEMAILRSSEIVLNRPVRLLHPRFPLYAVPWGDGHFMVGATVIEREDDRPVTARSALDLLGHAYALHPAFGEAEIVELGAGVRPAFADNAPKIVVDGRRLYINGMFRHGFLCAPALAELVARYLAAGEKNQEVFVDHCVERNSA